MKRAERPETKPSRQFLGKFSQANAGPYFKPRRTTTFSNDKLCEFWLVVPLFRFGSHFGAVGQHHLPVTLPKSEEIGERFGTDYFLSIISENGGFLNAGQKTPDRSNSYAVKFHHEYSRTQNKIWKAAEVWSVSR